jgi:hypothetical protein
MPAKRSAAEGPEVGQVHHPLAVALLEPAEAGTGEPRREQVVAAERGGGLGARLLAVGHAGGDRRPEVPLGQDAGGVRQGAREAEEGAVAVEVAAEEVGERARRPLLPRHTGPMPAASGGSSRPSGGRPERRTRAAAKERGRGSRLRRPGSVVASGRSWRWVAGLAGLAGRVGRVGLAGVEERRHGGRRSAGLQGGQEGSGLSRQGRPALCGWGRPRPLRLGRPVRSPGGGSRRRLGWGDSGGVARAGRRPGVTADRRRPGGPSLSLDP